MAMEYKGKNKDKGVLILDETDLHPAKIEAYKNDEIVTIHSFSHEIYQQILKAHLVVFISEVDFAYILKSRRSICYDGVVLKDFTHEG